jgi:hypothetical protein
MYGGRPPHRAGIAWVEQAGKAHRIGFRPVHDVTPQHLRAPRGAAGWVLGLKDRSPPMLALRESGRAETPRMRA